MKRFSVLLLAAVAAITAATPDLFEAVRNNDLAAVRAALKQGADVNTRDKRQATLLMYAAAFGSPEAVRLLLDAGADVNAKNAFDATALMWGAGDAAKARMLVEAGADVNARSKQGKTPLLIAAAHDGAGATVRLLLARGADLNATGDVGQTALLEAAYAGDMETVRLLLEKGANVNHASKGGYTALHNAVASNNLPMVKLLLAKGANVNVANSFGGTVKFGNIALIKLTPLMFAAPHGSPEMVKTLLDAGASVNEADSRGMTALMFAVASETQDPAVVRLLLKAGADVNVKGADGEAALDWAVKYNNAAVLSELRKAGAKTAVNYAAPRRVPFKGDARAAVEKSTALMQRSSTEFFKQSGCVGCHHQNFTAVAVQAARASGTAVDEKAAAEQTNVTKFGWSTLSEAMLQRIDPPGGAEMTAWSLIGLAAGGHQPDAITDAMVANIAGMQQTDGSWVRFGVSRAPIEEGNINRTAVSVRGLQLYGWPARQAEFSTRISRARGWLRESRPSTTDDLAMRLLGLKWSGAGPADVDRAARDLLAVQRADGGWGQNPNLASDAYATGQALYALREAGGLKPGEAACQKGVRFLLGTQSADGSWYVRSRAPKFQPYFQSGFPYDHDQWISASATAWATVAVAGSLEPQRASR